MRTPLVVVNFKTYPGVCGEFGLNMARMCAEAAGETGGSVAVAPQQCDLSLVVHSVKVPVLAQHVDAVPQGATTGHITPEGVKAIGCAGTLLNHSEHRIRADQVEETVARCRAVGLETVVCTNTVAVSKAYAHFEPTFIAIEPPELIGGDVSVTTAKPEIVSDSVKAVKLISPKVRVLCGAGVKNGADVRKALELGAEGVLLASGVVKAKNPKAVVVEMLRAL